MTQAPPMPDLTSASAGQTRILTGEAVHLDIRVAGIGSRALARMIDLIIQFILLDVLLIAALIAMALLGSGGVLQVDDASLTAVTIVVVVLVLVGYPVLLETLTRGRTLGKLIFGLRVVRDDGGPVTFRQALTRGLVAFAIEWPGLLAAPVSWLVTIWVMIASPLSKRLGDHVAGTIVIHERTPAAWGWVPAMPAPLSGWAATLDLAGLDDELAFAVRSFLARNRKLREPARSVLGERLVREVAAATNPPPPAATPAWMYLAAVHAERHRRAMVQLASVRARAATVWPDLASVIAPPSWSPAPSKRRKGAVPTARTGSPVNVRPAQPSGELPH